MRKILLILFLLTAFVFAKAQNPIPADSAFPIKQSVANTPSTILISNVVQGKGGFVNGRFIDTTAANRTKIKFYPGAQIFTSADNTTWIRNALATQWINISSSGGITITNLSDTTVLICFSDGSCDTLFTGFFFQNDSTIISCSPERITCVGDSCFKQQICDTISIPKITTTIYQNLTRLVPNTHIVEAGNVSGDLRSSLSHDTWLYTNYHTLNVDGTTQAFPPFTVRNNQWSQIGSSIMSFNHYGAYHPPWNLPDANNQVKLYVNYTDPFIIPPSGALAGDTVGFMGGKIGYLFMTNSSGWTYHYEINDLNAKQVGIFFPTYPTNASDYDGVTIFGYEHPSTVALSQNPPSDSTLLDARIANFKTTGQVQFNQYTTGAFPITSPLYIIAQDASGNLYQYPPAGLGGGGGGGLFFARDDARNNSGGNMYFSNASEDMYWDSVANFTIAFSSAGGQAFEIQDANASYKSRLRINSLLSNLYSPDEANYFQATDGTLRMVLSTTSDSLLIDNLTNYNLQDRLLGQKASSGRVGYITVGTGLSLSAGVLSASGISGITADNGLTANTATNVQLGSSSAPGAALLHDTYIDATASYELDITGSKTGTNGILQVSQTGSGGTAIYGTASGSTSSKGVRGYSTTGVGVWGESAYLGVMAITTTGTSINAQTTNSGLPIEINALTSNTTASHRVIRIRRPDNGTVAAGFGSYIGFEASSASVGDREQGTISTYWTIATDATRTAQTDISDALNGTVGKIASFHGSGVVGIGISSSYTATRLNVVDNAVGAASIVDITSTSTAAASNVQKGINISLSGANSNSTQSTFGIHSTNSHTGTSSTNYGGYFTSSGATTNYGVYGNGATYGVYGNGSTYGVFGNASTYGVYGTGGAAGVVGVGGTGATGVVGQATEATAISGASSYPSTNDVVSLMTLTRTTSGTAANGLGGSFDFNLQDADGNTDLSNQIISKWTTAANLTRISQFVFTGVTGATTQDWLILGQSGYVKFRPMTVTEAGAIATAEGLMIFVSNTDATFTSIGLWIYQNAAWHAL